jgi:hypothetical protein
MSSFRLHVTDDSGFLALVDPDAYDGFVGEDWNADELLAHLHEQMTRRHLLIWSTGQEGCWTVNVTLAPASADGAREVHGSIIVSTGRLLLTNYESLSIAAQFADVRLPEEHQRDLVIAIPPGNYDSRVIQHALVDGGCEEGCEPEFTVSLTQTRAMRPVWTDIPWSNAT